MSRWSGWAPARRAPADRAVWHRRANLLPVAYLAAAAATTFSHPLPIPTRWLLIHLLLLGAATNAIVVWSNHFAAALLLTPVPARRSGEVARLVALNAGVLAVLTGGTIDMAWLGVAGASGVFAAILAHLWAMARQVRRALPARFAVTVRYYLAAAVALLAGIPAGAWMLLLDDAHRPRLLLFHAHVNLLGWVTLTVLGTLVTLWPTVLRTRMPPTAALTAARALPVCLIGLAGAAIGVLAWWPLLAVAGVVAVAGTVLVTSWPGVTAARQRPPASFASWSIAAGMGWLLAACIGDAVVLLRAKEPADAADGFTSLVPAAAGFVAQVLLGALAYLLPMALGGGPAQVRQRADWLDRHWAARVSMTNLALLVFLLPVPPYVRITTSLLLLVALVQFLVPATRVLLSRSPAAQAQTPKDAARERPNVRPAHESVTQPRRAAPGVAVGTALVLAVVVLGAVIQYASDGAPGIEPSGAVVATGHTTTVEVSASGMRYHPDRIVVPAGDRLVIVLTNMDSRRHDLVLSNGARTALLAQHASTRLDAGIIGGTVAGWCSRPGHRQAGMTLTITTTAPSTIDNDASDGPGLAEGRGSPEPHAAHVHVDPMAEPSPGFTARDATLAPAPSGTTHRITLRAQEVRREVAPGVTQRLWTFNGSVPGPVLRGRVGDSFEITLINEASTEHGIDFHAEALAPDIAMRPVEPGESVTYRFTATRAGVWMYHCSAMPMLYHVGNGMYGALVIDPPDLAPADREYLLVQSELYLNTADQPGDLAKMRANQPDAIVFNGYVGQYAARPLAARVGERVRIWVLNAGPNRSSTFHVVGGVFNTVYAEGSYRLRPTDAGGAQVLDLAPASGGFVELSFTQAGTYPFLTHALADADLGATGAVRVARNE